MSRKVKVGTAFAIFVKQEHIDKSIPCDKAHCMLTLAAIDALTDRFGEDNYAVRSTNHGMTFDIGNQRVLNVFDHLTGHRIYKYDEMFRKTNNMEKAKASVKPFRAKLMVESCQKKTVYLPMSEEKKAALAAWRKKHPRKKGRETGINTTARRQLSE